MHDLFLPGRENISWNAGGLFCHDSFILDLHDRLSLLGLKSLFTSVFGNVSCSWYDGSIAEIQA